MVKLNELDTTGIKNWLGQKRDALHGAVTNNPRVLAKHGTRLVANKLYRAWQGYLGQQDLQGTSAELAEFINEHFGEGSMGQMQRLFPNIFPSDNSNPPAPPSQPTGQQPAQQAQQPAQQAQQPAQAQSDDLASQNAYQGYVKNIVQLLQARPTNGPAVVQEVEKMIQDFSGRSDKAKQWVSRYITNQLSGWEQVIPELQQYVGKDPFSVGQNPPQQQSQQPQQSQDLSIPPPPRPFQQKQTSSRSIRGNRLVEVPSILGRGYNDPNVSPAQEPGPEEVKPDMQQPPAFLRRQKNNTMEPPEFLQRQKNNTAPPAPPATPQAQAVALGRAQQDQIFVALAKYLLKTGGASIGPAPSRSSGHRGNNNKSSAGHYGSMGVVNAGQILQTRITREALNQGIKHARANLANDAPRLDKIVGSKPEGMPIAEIMREMGVMEHPDAVMQALLFAAEFA